MEPVKNSRPPARTAARRVGVSVSSWLEQHRDLFLQAFLYRLGQLQAVAATGEIDLHDDGRRMALEHRGAKGVGGIQRFGVHAEEVELLCQAFGALQMLKSQVHRFAQGRQGGVLETVAVAQPGAR